MGVVRIVVLASGRGTNFNAIIDAIRSKKIQNAEVVGLISDRASSRALSIATEYQIPKKLVDSDYFKTKNGFDTPKFELELSGCLKSFSPDLICLAGFMRILSQAIVQEWKNKIINIHPSLLPAFKGLRAQRQAIEHGVKWTGCTVHLVTEELDGGPILVQKPIEVFDHDTEETLSNRLLKVEHEALIEAISKWCSR